MIKKNKWQLILSSVIILLPVVFGLLMWNDLPEKIATHWSVNDQPDGWSGRAFTIFGLPLILLAAQWLCVIVTAYDPKNKEQSNKVFSMVLWIMPMVSLIVCGFTYANALGKDLDIGMAVSVLLGLMFVVIGNYMPKCKQNHTIGIKVTWTLRNEENWNKTHRFAGRLWVFGGLLFLVSMPVPLEHFTYVFLPIILVLAFAPMVYSYVYYRKQLKAGTASKEDAVPTPFEKKATKISIAIGTIILVLAALFLVTGKFEVKFKETTFTIEAAYWEDAHVTYADIDQIEYREEKVPGMRTYGYGSPFLVMGQCENSEFGDHTRYTYTSCDAAVVLTVDDNILVINGKDIEQTKAIYEELISRVKE